MLLSKLSKFCGVTSSLSGADKVLRLLAYLLKLISSWLQWKARSKPLTSSDLLKVSFIVRSVRRLYHPSHQAVLFTELKNSNPLADPSAPLPVISSSRELTNALDHLAISLMETRTVLRLFGTASSILDFHTTTLSLLSHLHAARSDCRALYISWICWLQSITMICYYPCDHLYWLWSKGALKSMSQSTANRVSQWSCRGWAVYILLDMILIAIELADVYRSKRHAKMLATTENREASPLFNSESLDDDSISLHTSSELLDAPSLVSVASIRSPKQLSATPISTACSLLHALKSDPKLLDLSLRALINLSDLPLALHWSFDKCQLSSLAVAAYGTVSSFAGLYRRWHAC